MTRNVAVSDEINALFEVQGDTYVVEVLGGGKLATLCYFGHCEPISADVEAIRARVAALDAAYPVLRADRAAKVEKAAELSAAAGCTVEYRDHGRFCVSYGATARTNVLPDATSVRAALEAQLESYWNRADPLPEAQ